GLEHYAAEVCLAMNDPSSSAAESSNGREPLGLPFSNHQSLSHARCQLASKRVHGQCLLPCSEVEVEQDTHERGERRGDDLRNGREYPMEEPRTPPDGADDAAHEPRDDGRDHDDAKSVPEAPRHEVP